MAETEKRQSADELNEMIWARQQQLAQSVQDLKAAVNPGAIKKDAADAASSTAAATRRELEAKTVGKLQGDDGDLRVERVAIVAAIGFGIVALYLLKSIRAPKD